MTRNINETMIYHDYCIFCRIYKTLVHFFCSCLRRCWMAWAVCCMQQKKILKLIAIKKQQSKKTNLICHHSFIRSLMIKSLDHFIVERPRERPLTCFCVCVYVIEIQFDGIMRIEIDLNGLSGVLLNVVSCATISKLCARQISDF